MPCMRLTCPLLQFDALLLVPLAGPLQAACLLGVLFKVPFLTPRLPRRLSSLPLPLLLLLALFSPLLALRPQLCQLTLALALFLSPSLPLIFQLFKFQIYFCC